MKGIYSRICMHTPHAETSDNPCMMKEKSLVYLVASNHLCLTRFFAVIWHFSSLFFSLFHSLLLDSQNTYYHYTLLLLHIVLLRYF